MRLIDQLGVWTIRQVEGIGGVTLLGFESVIGVFQRPFRWRLFLQQFEFIGAGSLLIVLLTGTFTGMVLSVQSAYAFQLFNAESLVGATVALALTRELAPVLTGLMVTGRVGSSIATEIGTMGVTEQIDALRSMAVNPVQYLVTPRVVAATVMVPVLCMLSNIVGIFGAWLVGVKGMGLDEGVFFDRIQVMVLPWDVWSGIIKSAFFGFALSVIACYKGYTASGGARGVGMATTQAVVTCSLVILMLDYILTVLMF